MTRLLRVLPAALMLALACAFSAPAAGKGPVDLRSMSRTMAFAAVYDMQVNPGTYVGRLVRMNGSFATFEVRPGEKKAPPASSRTLPPAAPPDWSSASLKSRRSSRGKTAPSPSKASSP